MKKVSIIISILLIFVGCANIQEKSNTIAPKGVKVRTASYSTEC